MIYKHFDFIRVYLGVKRGQHAATDAFILVIATKWTAIVVKNTPDGVEFSSFFIPEICCA